MIKKRVFSIYSKEGFKAIILFGSRARENFDENSDYDIDVVVDKHKNYGKKFR